MNDLRERMKAAISTAERRNGGTAHHVTIRRDGSIAVETSREQLGPSLNRAFPLDPPAAATVSRGAMQGAFDELLDQLPTRKA